MKLKFLLLVFLVGFFIFPQPALARKKLTRSISQKPSPKPELVWEKLKLRGDRHAVLLILGGMDLAKTVDYTLTYTTDEVPQGIQGFHPPENGNTQIEILFGTCSGSNCNYHQNITDMFLEIKYQFKQLQESGRTLTRRYQIHL